ncbi:MAG: SCP2 sterol-binding domain-containing protein [Clostridium sp.]|nr:SCP2 sterol-binding domain-containing protein [Clostridium sp.]
MIFTKINIYYGGRGLIEDPTIYVLNRMTEVLKELRVEVERYNIFEDKNAIATLPSTLKDADCVILAATVEWFGIGGYMQQFLDMCWLYADKQELSNKYMLPVVMATTYGERDAELSLVKAWETLGGIPITGLVAYVENLEEFEQNESYRQIIERKVETLYRTVSQKIQSLPTSNLAVKTNLLKTRTIELTPQESEQLSKFVSDESYVKQQKEDIEELSAMFKQMLSSGSGGNDEDEAEQPSNNKRSSTKNQKANKKKNSAKKTDKTGEGDGGVSQESGAKSKADEAEDELIGIFLENYHPEPGFAASYAIILSDRNKILHIEALPEQVKAFFAATKEADVILRTTTQVLSKILAGKNTFQRGFMAGEISAKGRFENLRMLDTIFPFSERN